MSDDLATLKSELRWDFIADPPSRLIAELNLVRSRLRRGDWREARRASARLLRNLDAEPAPGVSGLMPARRAEIRADGLAVQAITATLMRRKESEDVLAASLAAYEDLKGPRGELRPSGLAGYGMVLALTGRHHEAIEPLARAAEAGEDVSMQVVLSAAGHLVAAGNCPGAVRLLRAVHERYPNEPDLAASLAEAYQADGQPHEAAAAHVDAGSLLAESGHLEAALDHFDRASGAVPNHPLAALGRCQVLVATGRPSDALTQLGDLGHYYPQLAGTYVVSAIALIELGRTQDAMAQVDRALEEFPDDLWSLDVRVRVLLALRRPGDAISALDSALTVDPTDRLWRGLRAEVRIILGEDVDTSLQILRELAAASPGAADPSVRLTRVLRAMGRGQEALEVVSVAIEEQADNASLLVLQIELLRELGRPRDALNVAARAVKRGLPRWLVALPVARARLDIGDIDGATAIAEEAAADRPSPSTRAVLGLVRHKAGRHEEAIVELEAAQASPEPEPFVRFALAGSLAAIGVERLDAGLQAPAVEFFERALELNPDQVEAHRWLAEVYRLSHEYVKALGHANIGIGLDPDNGWLIGTRGQILDALTGKEDEAEADLRRAVELDPELNWARTELGDLLRVRKRYHEAIEVLREVARRTPDDPWPLSSWSAAEYAIDNYEEALRLLTKALRLKDDYAWAHGVISAVYADIDRLPEARSHAIRAIDLDPTMDWVWIHRGWIELLELFGPDGSVKDPEAAERAIEAYRSVVGTADDWANVMFAEASLAANRPDDAIATFEAVAGEIRGSRRPDAAQLQHLGWCELRLGNHDDAVESIVSAISLDASNVSPQFDLALTLLCAGRHQIAMEEYTRAIAQLQLVPHPGRRRALVRVAQRDLSSLSIDQLAHCSDVVGEVRRLLNDQGGENGTDGSGEIPVR